MNSHMHIYTVCFFGHRDICNLQRIETRLVPILKNLLNTKSYVAFYIGRNGEFDTYVASIIKRVCKDIGKHNSDLTLVLPYTVADLPYCAKYYDAILIPDCIGHTHPKAAITKRNKWMVDASDLVICYVEKESGGAHAAMKYANETNKPVINIAKDHN